MAERIDLDDQADIDPVALAQGDEAIEDRLPVAVAREIVVGDEVAPYALLPWTLMMVQKEHWNGQP